MIYDEQGCFYQPPGYKIKRIRAKEMSEQDRTQFWSDLEAGSSETLDWYDMEGGYGVCVQQIMTSKTDTTQGNTYKEKRKRHTT